MKDIALPSGKTVRLPSTGEDWQLYTSSMACGRAAYALTSALTRAVQQLDAQAQRGFTPTPAKLEELYSKILGPVMLRYAKFGAADTEPRGVAFDALERAVKVGQRACARGLPTRSNRERF